MSKYTSKMPDSQGFINYSDTENKTWSTLMARQLEVVKDRAAQDFLNGLDLLALPHDSIPQLPVINQTLQSLTGWRVTQVPAIIKPIEFFQLLKDKTFPAATFIRVPEEIDYLQEPDIFHEIFGHCPMICHPYFSEFMREYGVRALKSPTKLHKFYARLFWFTVEFGLIEEKGALRCYGGGILSSIKETPYALEDKRPVRKPFELLEVLRTPYRYDQIQQQYFVIQSYQQLYEMIDENLESLMYQALELGDYAMKTPSADNESGEWVTC